MNKKLILKSLSFSFIFVFLICGCSQSQAQKNDEVKNNILLDDLIEAQRNEKINEENSSNESLITYISIYVDEEKIEEEKNESIDNEIIEIEPYEENVISNADEETIEIKTESFEEIEDKQIKYVCLTFDDGPHKTNTEEILELLKEYDAVATFFEVGYLVNTYPDIVKEEYDMGCEVENHTYSHINMNKYSYQEIVNEITKCSDAIYNATGEYPTFVRPPYGNLSMTAIGDCNLAATNWSVDTRDWESRNKDKIMEVIKNEGDLNGQVILMHSTHHTTVEALKLLLPYLEENGYQTLTLKEMFSNVYGEEITPGKFYGYTYYINKK